MAFARESLAGSAGAGGRALGSGGQRPLSDINVTPLVDVMLVLLVIFMITAPLMASSLRLDLPRAAAAGALSQGRFLSVALDAGGQLFLDDRAVASDELLAAMRQAVQADPDSELRLRADQAVAYGRVARVMDLAQQAGLRRVAFVTERKAP